MNGLVSVGVLGLDLGDHLVASGVVAAPEFVDRRASGFISGFQFPHPSDRHIALGEFSSFASRGGHRDQFVPAILQTQQTRIAIPKSSEVLIVIRSPLTQ